MELQQAQLSGPEGGAGLARASRCVAVGIFLFELLQHFVDVRGLVEHQVVCCWATTCSSGPICGFTVRLLSSIRVVSQLRARPAQAVSNEGPALPSKVARACSSRSLEVRGAAGRA